MPELPEVETIKRGLSDLIIDKKILEVVNDWPKSLRINSEELDNYVINARFRSVDRRAKLLILNLSTGYSLIIHLKMTGQVVYDEPAIHFGAGHPSDSLIAKLPDKTTRVIFNLNKSAKLYFNDMRKFGWIKLLKSEDLSSDEFIKNLGPEPLADNFNVKELTERLNLRRNSNLKAVLLDQKIIAGLGNIYADESAFSSQLHPQELIKNLNKSDYKKLYQAIIENLRLSLKMGGSTNKNYVNALGQKGNYLNFANVYNRQGQTCHVCGEIIIKIRVAGRGTHYCPNCQKLKTAQ